MAQTIDPSARATSGDITDLSQDRLSNLRLWNIGLTVLHGVQAVLILVLASDFAITVTSTFPEGPPGTRRPLAEGLFDVRIGAAIALFLGPRGARPPDHRHRGPINLRT